MAEAKPKKFIKLLAKHLGSNGNAEDVHVHKPKRLLKEAVASLPEGPLKTAINKRFGFYSKKLKLLICTHDKTKELPELNEKQKFPYNLYTNKTPSLPGTSDDDQTQQIYGALLCRKLDVDPVETLVDLLAKIDEENVDVLLLNLTCGITSYLGLLKMMHLYIIVVQPKAESTINNQKAQSSGEKIKTEDADMCRTLCDQVKNFLSMCHLRHSTIQKPEAPVYLYSYWDLLSSLLAVFIDLYLLTNRKSNKQEQASRRLCNVACYLTEDKPSFRLDTMVQMSKVHTNINLLLPFVRRTFEKKPVTGDFQHYLKYVLALRTVCDITNESNMEENSEIHTLRRQTGKMVPAPKHFLDWLMNHNDGIIDEMPVEDRRFKGSNVTRFILEEADDKLLSLLTDTLTHFDEEMEDQSSKKRNKSAKKKRKLEKEMNGQEKLPDSELFFLDTGGSKQDQDLEMEEHIPKKKKKQKKKKESEETTGMEKQQDTQLFFLDKVGNKEKQATDKQEENQETEVYVIDTTKFSQYPDDIEIIDQEESDDSIEITDITIGEPTLGSSDEEEIEADDSDRRDMEEDESEVEGQSDDSDTENVEKVIEGNLVRNIGETMDEDIVADDDVDTFTDMGRKNVDNENHEDDAENSDEQSGVDECAEDENVVDSFEGKSDQEQTEEMLASFVNKSPREVLEEDSVEREVILSTPEQKKPLPELPVSGRSTRQRQTSKSIGDTKGASQLSVKQQAGDGSPGIHESSLQSTSDKKPTPFSVRTRSSDKPSEKLPLLSHRKSTPGKGLPIAKPESTSPKKRPLVTSPGNTSPSKRSSVDTPIATSTKKRLSVDTPKCEKRLFKDVLEFTSEDVEVNLFSPKKQVKETTPKPKGTRDQEMIDGSGETSVKTATKKRKTELNTPNQSKQIDVFDFESDEEVILKTMQRKQTHELDRTKTPKSESNRLKTPHTPKTERDKFKTPESIKERKKSLSGSGKEPMEITDVYDLNNEVIPDSNDSDGESACGEDFPLLNSPVKDSCKVMSRSNKTLHTKKGVPTPEYTNTPRPQRTRRISTEKLTSIKSHNSHPSPAVDVQHSPEQSWTSRRRSRTSASVDSDVVMDSGDTAVSELTAANLATKASPGKRYSLRATRQRRESGNSNVSNSSMVTRSRKSVSEDLDPTLNNSKRQSDSAESNSVSNLQNKTQGPSRLQTLDEDTDSDEKVISFKETQTRSSKRKSLLSTTVESPRKSGRRYSLREKD